MNTWKELHDHIQENDPEYLDRIAAGEVPRTDISSRYGVGDKIARKLRAAMTGDEAERFRKYLVRGRTEKELEKFGDNWRDLLKAKYNGYNLFEQRNRYGEPIWILLPEITRDWTIQPRKWKYSISPADNGLVEPYIVTQLPRFKDEIIIAPLFDVHYGHQAHRHEKFLSYIRWIEETPNVFAICGGDLMENALDDGRGMSYDQIRSPQNQLDEMTAHLARIAHKILVMIPGNHEERTHKKTGVDVMRVMADRLDVPYFDGPIFLSVLANSYRWNFYVTHGRGNAQTKGGKMNNAGRPRKFTEDIQFFISGHVHDRIVESEIALFPNPVTCTLDRLPQWTVVCPSFLGWADTYAYRAGYAPPSSGGVSIHLKSNGEYAASLT